MGKYGRFYLDAELVKYFYLSANTFIVRRSVNDGRLWVRRKVKFITSSRGDGSQSEGEDEIGGFYTKYRMRQQDIAELVTDNCLVLDW